MIYVWYQRPGETLWRHEKYTSMAAALFLAGIFRLRGYQVQIRQGSLDHE